MRNSLKNIIVGIIFTFGLASPLVSLTIPSTVSAAKCESRVLGIPPWYRGLTVDGDSKPKTNADCSIAPIVSGKNGKDLSAFIWKIAINIIEMVIVIIAYVAVFFIIYGGFQFMTGGSNPGAIEKARKTITNAVVGLVIAMVSIGAVNLIFSIIT